MDTLAAAADSQGTLEGSGAFNSDDDSESCPICLNAFREQAVGTPENCAHYFCLDCIVEWSKVRGRVFGLGSGWVTSPWPAPGGSGSLLDGRGWNAGWRPSLVSALSPFWALGWLVTLTLGSTERGGGWSWARNPGWPRAACRPS